MTGFSKSQRGAIVAEISKLRLGPGEVLIVRPKDDEWTIEMCQWVRDALDARLPAAVRNQFFICSQPFDLDVVAARLNS